MNRKIVLGMSVLLMSMLACGFDFNLGGSSEDENILFKDDFSNSSSGWDRYAFESGSTDYEDGAYRILVLDTSYSVWANPGRSYDDVRVEVDATKAAGPDDNEFGIICRYLDENNFYAAVLTSDGFYGFWKRVNASELQLIGMEILGTTDAVNPGGSSNHLRLDCIGDTLSLYANGTLVGEVQDSELSSGDVGLYAGSYELPGVDILFDNFVVYKP